MLERYLANQHEHKQLERIAQIVNLTNAKLRSRDSSIGHSYFMRDDLDESWFRLIWESSIMPLIEDRFIDQPNRVKEFELETLRAEAGGPRGFDAGKKIKGRKRHILTDTSGLLVGAVVHAADIQDRDGAPSLLSSIRSAFPWLRHVFADGGYAGEKLEQSLVPPGDWTIDIVKRSDLAKGFVLLPLGRRADPRLDQPQPPACQGLREINHHRRGVDHDRQRQTHHKAIAEDVKQLMRLRFGL